ncbi:flagellar protein FlgN [Caproiciproducens sp. MSJ-32]|uniref:flagellar protein FlgN n=1 Tax=Caproiciproducens sp. MSJ-32 TaxID=2841527 RepID=UPI001C11363F|nr:flagellar protein FlgN [Caproiciproducens sp. MSJ-32]MBU5454619.1 flagellar protein FlgN [Caproiciproducens sp. MSJ-32]
MVEELKNVLIEEEKELRGLLELLDKQYKLTIKKEVYALEAIVEDIMLKNKDLAESEVKRRRILGNQSMKDLVANSQDKELEDIYRRIQRLLNEIKLQKDTNELLIKQQLSFTNKLLSLINPQRNVTTYNSYGNIRR